MALIDTKLRSLEPRDKPYVESDEGGLHLEVSKHDVRRSTSSVPSGPSLLSA